MSNTTGITDYVNCRIQEYSSLSTKRFEDARYKNNVHFLKQFKVGGTTISSVLRKIILKYGALLVPFEIINVNESTKNREIPKTEFEERIGPRRMLLYKGGKCRLFYSQHCGIWDYSRRASPMAEKIFNKNDTIFLTIVRHPVEKFKSWMQFGGHSSEAIHHIIMKLQRKCPYLNSSGCGEFVDVLPCENEKHFTCVKGSYSVFNETRALQYLNQFDLVMITEQMSESIVIMAHILGFPVEELGTVKLRAVTSKFHNYTTDEFEILGKYYRSHMKLYQLAIQKLEERKIALGNKTILQGVTKLKEANYRTEKICDYQFVPEDASTKEYRSRFRIDKQEMLSDPVKLVECLPLLDAPRNMIEGYIVESLQDAHKHVLSSKVEKSTTISTQYPYSLLTFSEKFKKKSHRRLMNSTLFFLN